MKKTTQKHILSVIQKAGKTVACATKYNHHHYSCHALMKAGASSDFSNQYWHRLMRNHTKRMPKDFPQCGSLESAMFWYDYYDKGYYLPWRTFSENRKHRMMMLAWLHEMVRSGEFYNIADHPRNRL